MSMKESSLPRDRCRERCVRLISTLAGCPDGLRAFLAAPQPDMDGRLGAELLQEWT
jgi:hypothetical protein